MTFEWDASDLGLDDSPELEESPAPPAAPAAPLRREPEMVTTGNTKMTEVERRLEMAYYYRLLLNDSLFVDADSEIAQFVEGEIRSFVQERLEILLGIKHPQPKAEGFTPIEVAILKKLTSKLVQRAEEPEPEPAPEPPRAPAVAPIGPPARKKSGIRKVSAATIDAPSKSTRTAQPEPTVTTAPQKPVEAPQSVEVPSDGSEFIEVEVNGQKMRRRRSARQIRPPGALPPPGPAALEQMAHRESGEFSGGIIGLAVQAMLQQ